MLSQHELPVSVRHAMALVAFHLPCRAGRAMSLCCSGLKQSQAGRLRHVIVASEDIQLKLAPS